MQVKPLPNISFFLYLSATFSAVCLLAPPAHALLQDAQLCDAAAQSAAFSSDTPTELLQAISRVESGRKSQGVVSPWPWTVNYAGQGYWFGSQKEAYGFAQSLLENGNDNFDLGCFQINLRWHGDKFSSLEQAFTPSTNALVAAQFLHSLFQRKGNWSDAVAAYHSQTQQRGQAYLTKVEAALQEMRGANDSPQLEEIQTVQATPENNFPLFRVDAGASGPSLVPQNTPARPLFEMAP